MFYNPNIHRCEHIKVNGTQCGSPSIRHKRLCFFHGRWQDQRLAIADSVASVPAGISIAPALNMPILEDANSVQVAIMHTISLLLTGQVEHKTAALLLYGLQTASSNLRRTGFEAYPHHVVINPATVDQTRMGEDVWKDSDFNAKEKEEEDDQELEEEIKDDGDENNSPEETGVPAMQEHSAATNSANQSDSPPTDWRAEVRTKIAARVQHAALQGDWINQLLSSAKASP